MQNDFLIVASLAVVVSVSLAVPTMAGNLEEQQVMAITQAACGAFKNRDLKTVERLLSPDFTLVNSSSDIQSLAQTIAEIRSGEPRYKVFQNHDMAARVHADTAIVQGITSLKDETEGEPFASDVRFTDTLVRDHGEGKTVVSDVTRSLRNRRASTAESCASQKRVLS